MSNHTPGPWEFKGQGDADEFVMLTHDGKWIIAFRQNGELMTATQRANAKLMAASPRLLEALQNCLILIEKADKATGGDSYYTSWQAANARAAIHEAVA
jgi:hypothetical protein